MAKFPSLKVEKRVILGRKVKQLRRQGITPANLFGKQIESVAIQAPELELKKLYNDVGETGLIDVVLEDKKYPSLFAGVVTDPVSGKVLHVDLHHVSLKEKVTASIPVELIGESPAVKNEGGVLSQSLYEIEVEALPTDLPEMIQVDISGLNNIGDAILVGDLKLAQAVEVQTEPETPVVSVVAQQVEEVEEAPVETETTEQGPTKTDESESDQSGKKEA